MIRWIRNNLGLIGIVTATTIAAIALGAVAMGQSPALTLALLVVIYAVAWAIFRRWTRGAVAASDHWPIGKVLVSTLVAVGVVGAAIQPVPYGRDHHNDPVTAEPAWDAPRTRELAVAACFDCHSNEVTWPWYASIAPFSWNVQKNVDAGRNKVNYSEWDQPQHDADESAETVREGSMPPFYYTITHSGARLSDEEKEALARGFEATFAADPPIEDDHRERDDEDDEDDD